MPGSIAFSPFRIKKIEDVLVQQSLMANLRALYWHFIALNKPLEPTEQSTLEALLRYGSPSRDGCAAVSSIEQAQIRQESTLLLVLPRSGTVSPWSSKATEIAHHCGLNKVIRIERGIAFYIQAKKMPLCASLESVMLPLIHDRMTQQVVDSFDQAEALFYPDSPKSLTEIEGKNELIRVNEQQGLALSQDEINYLYRLSLALGRHLTDVEVTMFAQANSEHCRHKLFNTHFIVDGQKQEQTLFGMIRETHKMHPQGTWVAYADNAAVIQGATVSRFFPQPSDLDNYSQYKRAIQETHILIKVETHNHPTAVSPFAGAATGAGGEIRDEGATGRGAEPKAGLCGFMVSHLRLPGRLQVWENPDYGRPDRIACPLQIMIEGPIGAAAFNNEFGRPQLTGFFRTFEANVANEQRGYHKPIMIAGGFGYIHAMHIKKCALPEGTLLIQLGGPGMRIGMGGGAASSMTSGTNTETFDFDSVQRSNPEIQRRAQEVINRCWQCAAHNPILSIHDVGAGGLSNAFPELIEQAGSGAIFDLRRIPIEEKGLSPKEIWCNEAQERYVIAIAPDRLQVFDAICQRERCPYTVIGHTTVNKQLILEDTYFGTKPIDIPMSALFSKQSQSNRDVQHRTLDLPPLNNFKMSLRDALYQVLHFPAVADKRFLITIGDRTVGGLTVRDPLVGPWQIAVADVAVTSMDYDSMKGAAMAIGERTPLALISGPASGRLAIGEAFTNIAAACIGQLKDIKLSANWMAQSGHPGEDAQLYDTVEAVTLGLCRDLGISIPVGKDSLSMKTIWTHHDEVKQVTAPLSVIISAFAPVADVSKTMTPQLADEVETDLILIDLGEGRCRLGASALAQVNQEIGNQGPDLDHPEILVSFFNTIQALNKQGHLLAYHDRSDGGLIVTLSEMMFASHLGITIDMGQIKQKQDKMTNDQDVEDDTFLAFLFNEELGAVIQVHCLQTPFVMKAFAQAGLDHLTHRIGTINREDRLIIKQGDRILLDEPRIHLHQAWSETSWRIQKLRDHPDCADIEYQHLADIQDQGLFAQLTFDPSDDIAAPFIASNTRPPIAILREQGVNGHVEMAAAFDRAGFAAIDVHMSDLLHGRVSLKHFKGLAACGGFSYGDVLGAGEGWAKSILFNARLRAEFEDFFNRADTFGLGVCNGCQMMANLSNMIPGAGAWPKFSKNQSEQFEARLIMVDIPLSPSLFFEGMIGSQIPVVVSHGEGLADFSQRGKAEQAIVAMRYIDHQGHPTQTYPYNPNGSPNGIAGLTTHDGRFSILMPHPERLFRTLQYSWHPKAWGDDGPWMRMFRNARKALG